MYFRERIAPLSIIVALDEDGGFAKDGKIPWINEPWAKEDLKHFQEVTKGGVCIMGRNTYEDMLEIMKGRGKKEKGIKEILPGRQSYVVTRNNAYKAIGAKVVHGIRDAVNDLDQTDRREVFVIGGEKLFIEALAWTTTVYCTIINGDWNCDRFFPIKTLIDNYKIVEGSKNEHMKFVKYTRIR